MSRIKKVLSEMSLEELWQLFPIELAPHNPQWMEWAKDEINLLHQLLEAHSVTITHIGSTSIPSIQAKPIIDILVEIPITDNITTIGKMLESNGYILMSSSSDRLSVNKGYTSSGYADKVFHIHIHREGDNDEILFRDYLLSHPEEAREYESLKQSLLPRYRHNRDGYTEQKTDFVRKTVEKAKKRDATNC